MPWWDRILLRRRRQRTAALWCRAMTRAEHLALAKTRALDYVEAGDLAGAVASMISDLGKHEELRSIDLELLRGGTAAVMSRDPERVRCWVEGIA